VFDPHRQDRHRRAAVGAKDSRPWPRLHGWGEHNPQQQLEQLHQLLGQAVQQPVIPHSAVAPVGLLARCPTAGPGRETWDWRSFSL
jgi:hypothetical protein